MTRTSIMKRFDQSLQPADTFRDWHPGPGLESVGDSAEALERYRNQPMRVGT